MAPGDEFEHCLGRKLSQIHDVSIFGEFDPESNVCLHKDAEN
jgi:hypothetical protein